MSGVSNRKEAALLCGEQLRLNGLFFKTVKREAGNHYDKSCQAFDFSSDSLRLLNALVTSLSRLSVCFYFAGAGSSQKWLQNRMEQEQAKIMLLMEHFESICGLEHTGVSTCRLCTLPKALDFLLYEVLWSTGTPCVLTSATLSVSSDFTHFMRQTGGDLLERHRLMTTSKASPPFF